MLPVIMTLALVGTPAVGLVPAAPSLTQDRDALQSQVPDRGRPTRESDEVPEFDFANYFVGTWAFEWIMPDGPLGAGGSVTGTVEFKHLEGPFFEAITRAEGPDGDYTVRESIVYRAHEKVAVRVIDDSRGWQYVQNASVGGDLGGYYNLYYESPPVTVGARELRIRHAVRVTSPVRFRVQLTVSEDGGPFISYGNPWFEKQVGAVGSR